MSDNKYRTIPSWIDDFVNSLKKGTTKVADGPGSSSPSSSSVSGPSTSVGGPSMSGGQDAVSTPGASPMGQPSDNGFGAPSPSHGEANPNSQAPGTEININDLETITWNDETYKVLFDKENNSAAIINGFGNVVTTLPNTMTIDEVNKQLNARQIVVSSLNKQAEEMQDEISKAFAHIEDEDGNTVSTVEITYDEPDIDEMEEDDTDKVVSSEKIASLVETKVQEYINDNIDEILLNSKIQQYINDKVSRMVTAKLEAEKLRKIAEAAEEEELLDEDEDFEEADDLDNIEKPEDDIVEEEVEEEPLDEDKEEDHVDEEQEDKPMIEDMRSCPVQYEECDVHVDAIPATDGSFDYSNPVELMGKWREIFKEGICPDCSCGLEKCTDCEDKVEIQCSACKSKFYVDKNNEKIYKL